MICYNCSTDGLLQNERPKSINYWHDIYIYIISQKKEQ